MLKTRLHPIFGDSDLAKPLPRRKRESLLGPPVTDDAWKAEFQRRFILLLRHYRLDPKAADMWTRLMFCLAMDFVPGLREKPYTRRGRPNKKWKPESTSARRQLVEEFHELRGANRSISEYRTCELLAKRWRNKKGANALYGKSARTIYRELRLAQLESFRHSKSYDFIFGAFGSPKRSAAATYLTQRPEWSARGHGLLGNDQPTPPELADILDQLAPVPKEPQKS